MALKRNPPPRAARRVALTRSSGGAAPVKNRRADPKPVKSPKPKRSFVAPWEGIKQFFTTSFVIVGILIIVGGVGIGLFYAYNSLVSGEYFALKTIEIQGTSRLASREILDAAGLTEGGNTLALSIDAVEDAVTRHPWVEAVSVKRVLPGTLIIAVREKVPAFWVLHKGALQYADAEGRLIAPVIPGKFASLPMLEVEPGAEDERAALPDLVKSLQESRLPLNLADISSIRLSAARGMEVFVGDSRLKLSIGLEDWLPNLRRLSRTLTDLNRRRELRDVREIKAQGANVWVVRHAPYTAADEESSG